MKALNLADVFYLRALNILFIYYGANRTLKAILPKETGLPENAVSALQTSLIGVFISIGGLVYSYMQGGDEYIASLSLRFIWRRAYGYDLWRFLTFEGIVSAVIVTFTLMLIWKNDILLISTPLFNYVKPTFQLIHIASLELTT
jgi:hypothetical protein